MRPPSAVEDKRKKKFYIEAATWRRSRSVGPHTDLPRLSCQEADAPACGPDEGHPPHDALPRVSFAVVRTTSPPPPLSLSRSLTFLRSPVWQCLSSSPPLAYTVSSRAAQNRGPIQMSSSAGESIHSARGPLFWVGHAVCLNAHVGYRSGTGLASYDPRWAPRFITSGISFIP